MTYHNARLMATSLKRLWALELELEWVSDAIRLLERRLKRAQR